MTKASAPDRRPQRPTGESHNPPGHQGRQQGRQNFTGLECSTRALFDKFVDGCLPGSAGKTAAGTGSPSWTVTPWRSPLNAQASGTSTTKSTGVVLNVPPTGQGSAARPTRSQGCDHGFGC